MHEVCPALQAVSYLHGVQHVVLRVVHQLDHAVRPAPHIFDDQVLVDEDVALQDGAGGRRGTRCRRYGTGPDRAASNRHIDTGVQ